MQIPSIPVSALVSALSLLICSSSLSAYGDDSAAARLEFFEQRIRPVLVEHCYRCHSSDDEEPAGGLKIDSRDGIREGGNTGPAVVPGDVDQSLLMTAIQYEILEMPPDAKLDDETIEDFRLWIAQGAEDSRADDSVPVESPAGPLSAGTSDSGVVSLLHSAWAVSLAAGSCWPGSVAAAVSCGL